MELREKQEERGNRRKQRGKEIKRKRRGDEDEGLEARMGRWKIRGIINERRMEGEAVNGRV